MSVPLPKHIEIAEALTRRVAAGLLADGARLAPERALAAEWGVAVGTLRKALSALAERGMLDRVQGSGNYIRAGAASGGVYGLFRLELATGGGLPTAEVLALDRLPRPAALPESPTPAHRIRRLRRLDGQPVAVEEIWFLHPGDLAAPDLSHSLYLTWAQRFGRRAARIEDRVGLAPLPDWTPDALRAAPRAGHVERRTWDEAGALMEFSWTWFDPQVARFVSRTGE